MLRWGEVSSEPLWARVWLYGLPGTGKTVAAACWPHPFFVFVHNEDSKTSLRSMGQIRYVEVGVPAPGDTSRSAIPVRQDVDRLLDTLIESNARGALHQEFGQTIIFDSMTHLNDLVTTELARGNKRNKMDQQEWGLLQDFYLRLRDQLFALPVHVIFTSFARKKTAGTVVVDAGPRLQGSAADLLPGSCSALGYCDQDAVSGQRVVYFHKYNDYPARHRYPGAPAGPIPNHQLWAAFAPSLGFSAG